MGLLPSPVYSALLGSPKAANRMRVNLNQFPGAGSTGHLTGHQCHTKFNPLHSSGFENSGTIRTLNEMLELPAANKSRKSKSLWTSVPDSIIPCALPSELPAA